MTKFKLFELETRCPHCGALHECASQIEGESGPGPGDVTLCFSCGEWCVFDDEGRGLVKPDDETLIAIGSNPECYMVRASWLAYCEHRRRERA